MDKTLNNEKDVKNIAKIALKTFLDCFIGLMLILCSIFVLFPKFSLKINQTLGLAKVQEYNYQLIYKRSDNIADLYNVIICEENLGKTKKELNYLNEILARNDYQDFCKAMDNATISKLNDKKLIASTANVNGYLTARKVYCLYSLNSKNVESFVYQQTKSGKYKEYTFAVFVDLIVGDTNLTKSQKKELLSEFIVLSELDVENSKLISMEDLVEAKVAGLVSLVDNKNTTENDKLVYKYELMRYYGANVSLYEILGDEGKQESNLNLYNNLKSQIG